MLSLKRCIAFHVPLAPLRAAIPSVLHRAPLAPVLGPYRAISTSPLFYAERAAGKPKKTPARPSVISSSKSKAKPKKSKAKKPASTYVRKVNRPPKKPMPAFLLFFLRTTPNFREESVIERAKLASNAWRNLSEDKKQAYKEEWKLQYDKYLQKRDEWIKDPKNVENLKKLNKDRKKRGKSRIIIPDPGHIKRPIGAFFRYCTDLRKDPSMMTEIAPPGKPPQVWLVHQAAKQWKTLPSLEKSKYIKDFENDNSQYKKAVHL